jgi:hypothetical protein
MELGFRVKIYNPLLVTLAEDNAFPFFKINIRSIKFYQFSDPHTCGIQHINLKVG